MAPGGKSLSDAQKAKVYASLTQQRKKNQGNPFAQRGSGGAARKNTPSGNSYRVIKHGTEVKFK